MISKILENGNLQVTIPITFRALTGRRKIIQPNVVADGSEPLALALARAFRWQQYIDEGKFDNIKELARNIGQDEAMVARTMRLRLLSPAIVHRILTGDFPATLNLSTLRQSMPDVWEDQEKLLFGAE